MPTVSHVPASAADKARLRAQKPGFDPNWHEYEVSLPWWTEEVVIHVDPWRRDTEVMLDDEDTEHCRTRIKDDSEGLLR